VSFGESNSYILKTVILICFMGYIGYINKNQEDFWIFGFSQLDWV
jgi:hypothetical protein